MWGTLCVNGWSQVPIEISEVLNEYNLQPQNYTLYVDSLNLSFENIKQKKFQSTQIKTTKPEKDYWLKIKLKKNNFFDRHYIITTGIHVNDLTFFSPNKQKWDSLHIGQHVPFSNRYYHTRKLVFNLPDQFEDTITCYFKYHSNWSNRIHLTIQETSNYVEEETLSYIYYGFFYGFLIFLILYNIILWFAEKRKIYVYYVLYVLSIVFYLLHHDGLGFQYIWPFACWFNKYHSAISFYCLFIGTISYAFYTLSVYKTFPLCFKICVGIVVVLTIHLLLYLFGIKFNIDLSYLCYIVYLFILYVVSIRLIKKKKLEDILFLVGYILVIIGWGIYKFQELGVIYLGFFSDNYVYYALEIEALLFSFVIGRRVNILVNHNKKQRKQLVLELQEKERISKRVETELKGLVEARTIELQNQTNEYKLLNEKLQQMSEELDKTNWELNKKIRNERLYRLSNTHLSYVEFSNIFSDNISCQRYILQLKKQDKQCSSCKHTSFKEKLMNKKLYLICNKCHKKESITSGTIFHHVRFDLIKAMYLTYLVYHGTDDNTNEFLASQLDIRVATVWSFRKKVNDIVMKKSPKTWNDLILISKLK